MADRGIQLLGDCPIGAPGRPETRPQARRLCTYRRPRGDGIARRHGVDPAVVCIMWAVQRGQIPIQFSIHHDRANLEGGLSDPLSEEQMLEFAAIDWNCRSIQAHVFLSKTGQSWEDRWEMDGEIATA